MSERGSVEAQDPTAWLPRPGEFKPLELGPLRVWPPVVLAPMAAVTNYPYRSLCRRYGAGLCLSEMVSARALVETNRKSLAMAGFGPDERPRSLQLYGADPASMGEAVRRLVNAGAVDHLDLNFGCPVRKATSKGAGSAVPARPQLLAKIIGEAVKAAGPVPVSIKIRLGIDDQHLTYMSAGRIAEAEGCAAVGLHARTAAALYNGPARWEAIAELKRSLHIPVLGNGDIWEAADAVRMMRTTGADAVIVGRGCLGRPWLFRELSQAFVGQPPGSPPNLSGVIEVMLEHARALAAFMGEDPALRAFRRHACWYTKGFDRSAEARQGFMQARTLAELERVLADLRSDQPFPAWATRLPRGKRSGTQHVSLPTGYLTEQTTSELNGEMRDAKTLSAP